MINKLRVCYFSFLTIQASYRGEKTNWNNIKYQLYNLYVDTQRIKVNRSRNESFNTLVKKAVLKEIMEEYVRVGELVNNLKNI